MMAVFMGELVSPPPPIIAIDMKADSVSYFSNIIYRRALIFVEYKAITRLINDISYPRRKIYLDLL
ncbi:hypothetical protein [Bacteroides fragilis]|uniref:hypothetical protein n=1 Tax=Bacteroides fragilis TaxID=817 RepID=UPI0015FDCF8C|nr:hypothetical protein [Bacteroides fragilis]